MQLILKQTVDHLGEEGDVVKVRPGFGRNYLMPQGLAITATKGNLAQLAIAKVAIDARKKQQREEAEALAKKLEATVVTLTMRAGEDNKLYGSITSADIANNLAEQGIVVDRRKITLDEHIKTLGETSVTIKVGYQVVAKVTVNVEAQA